MIIFEQCYVGMEKLRVYKSLPLKRHHGFLAADSRVASRGDYDPKLALAYDSGPGNESFGFGWSVPLPTIHYKTAHGIPRYVDEDDLAVSEADIVRQLKEDGTAKTRAESGPGRVRSCHASSASRLWQYASREVSSKVSPGDVHWRTITSGNETTIYGDSDDRRILNISGGSLTSDTIELSLKYIEGRLRSD